MEKSSFFLCFALTFYFCLLQNADSLTTELQALLQFRDRLHDPLNHLESWKESESPCHFHGITCDSATGQVIGISLISSNLSGEISPSISVLRSLTSLKLQENSISGIVPPQLANCTSLQVLNISTNALTDPLPDLSALTNLQALDLSSNSFSGNFPSWLGKLSGLVQLFLAYNKFVEGEIPENVGNLKILRNLFLAQNNLRGEIPASISGLKSLQTLDLSMNQLSGNFPKGITTLSNLYKIELYRNNLTGEIPAELANLTHLREFDISRNQLFGKIPVEIGNLKNLTVLQLYRNNFWGELPQGFGDLHRKSSSIKEGKEGGGKDKRMTPTKAAKVSKSSSKGFGGGSGDPEDVEEEMRELWNTVVGQDSENDEEVVRTADDDAFIDDTGVDPSNRYGSDNEADFARNAPQAEEGEEDDDEVSKLFKGGKKKKKNEKSPAELAMIVERLMAELEVTAEEDAELNRQNKPAINKLKKLPMLTNVLSKKNLQQEFLDHGVLTLLKNWLEPLPDGSLPNMNVRTAVLQILSDLPIDLEQYDRREQLKKSGLGRVIMFLSKSDEETTSNRKLAKELVDKWSRPIFNKSTRYEDMRSFDNEKVPYRRPTMKKPVNKSSGLESRDDDLDLGDFSQGTKTSQAAARRFTSRPEALPLDFLVRPQSKIDPEEIRARAKHVVQDQRRLKMNKKLQQLKAPKKKQLQASKPSVEGRGMVKYL